MFHVYHILLKLVLDVLPSVLGLRVEVCLVQLGVLDELIGIMMDCLFTLEDLLDLLDRFGSAVLR